MSPLRLRVIFPLVLLLGVVQGLGAAAAYGQDKPIPPDRQPPPVRAIPPDRPMPPPPPATADQLDRHTLRVTPLERVGPGQFRMGAIQLDKTEGSVSFPAVVNMDRGLLEYLLVRTGGKTHESLLRTDVEPYNLHMACLLIGMEGTDAPLAGQGDPATPRGDALEIRLQYKDKDGTVRSLGPEAWVMQRRAELLRKGETQSDTPPLQWVYTGSVIIQGRLAAQAGGSIIAIYHDPTAMVDNASPGGEDDTIWHVKEGATPPTGTPVTVTLKKKH